MRISDWSSDVCSSDLDTPLPLALRTRAFTSGAIMAEADSNQQRIIAVELDEGSIVWRNADVEQESRVATFDLIAQNLFAPQRLHTAGYPGPYRLTLPVDEGRRVVDIGRRDGAPRDPSVT